MATERRANGRIAVAMSGGVDSSVSAALLVEQGYDVFGIMLRLWSESGQASGRDNRCCTRDQMIDAHFVARKLGISFEVIDARDEFKRQIVDMFIEGYRSGLTPNPCLACNRHIRFTFLLDQALARGATHLATGHYARVARADGGRLQLLRGIDQSKDQSYVLSRLSQDQLGKALFPVGSYTKPQIRELARKFGLNVAGKSDSQDLCFVSDGNYRRFLREHVAEACVPGSIKSVNGEFLGNHTGLPDYTIGQRKGLGISYPEPLYVMDKDSTTNTLIVGTRQQLGRTQFEVSQLHWIVGEPPAKNGRVEVRIRYKSSFVPALIASIDG